MINGREARHLIPAIEVRVCFVYIGVQMFKERNYGSFMSTLTSISTGQVGRPAHYGMRNYILLEQVIFACATLLQD